MHDEEGYVATGVDRFPPPQSIVFSQTDHVIAVRFSNFYLTEKYPQRSGNFGFRVVLRDLNSAIALSASQKRDSTIIQMVLTVVPVVFAILHLLLFLYNPRAKENLYYALFTLTFGALFFVIWQFVFFLVTDSRSVFLFMKLNFVLAPIAFIAGLRFLYALFYPRLPRQFWIFLLIGAGLYAWRLGHLLSLGYIGLYLQLFNMITVLEMARVVVAAIRRKRDGAWIIGAGFIFFAATVLWFFSHGILGYMGVLSLEKVSAVTLVASVTSGFFGLLLSMSVFLARNFAQTNKNLEAQLVQVKKLSAQTLEQERQIREEEVRRELSEKATRRKSAFLASMSHELRTPMSAITGFTRLVLRRRSENLTDRQRENLGKVTLSADHLLNLINGILDLSKIEAGRMDVDVKRFDVKALIGTCCAMVTPLANEKPGVKLTCDITENVGEAHTDEGRLRQIVFNLLSNALKFTESGTVSVHAEKEDEILVIAVSDTGTGIPADALDTIFEEFQQVAGSDPQHRGTGLGLPITKGFAELLGGSIGVESEAGKGSMFRVRIPMIYTEGQE